MSTVEVFQSFCMFKNFHNIMLKKIKMALYLLLESISTGRGTRVLGGILKVVCFLIWLPVTRGVYFVKT